MMKEGKMANGVRLLWGLNIELDPAAAKGLVNAEDSFSCLSDTCLMNYSELQPGKRYLVTRAEAAGDEGGAKAVTSHKRSQPAETWNVSAKRRKDVTTTEVALDNLAGMLKEFLSEHSKQGEEIQELKKSHKTLSTHVAVLEKYQLTGTTPLAAAYSLAEFAVETASALLRKTVAARHALMDYSVHKTCFRSVFRDGYIEDVDFCRAVVLHFKSTGVSLAEYWRSQGYAPQQDLCDFWSKTPNHEEDDDDDCYISDDLINDLGVVEKALAQELNVEEDEMRSFLRLYSTAVRHERNKVAHFFSVYDVSGRAARNKVRWMPSAEECKTRLEAAQFTAYKVVDLAALRTRFWVVERVVDQVEELQWFGEHSRVFRAFGGLLKSKFPELVAVALDHADAKRLAEFGCRVIHRLETGRLLVEKNGGRFKYCEETQAWEQETGNGWIVERDAWKLLLGV